MFYFKTIWFKFVLLLQVADLINLKKSAMKNETRPFVLGKLWPLLSQHWFKIGLVFLALYAFLNKDLSFNINIQAPNSPATQPLEEHQSRRQVRKETLTDNGDLQAQTTNRFNFLPSWGTDDSKYLILQLNRVEEKQIDQFIQRFAHVAEAEQEKFGIPASIILAHSLLYSQAGQHPLISHGNNYFGLPCTDDWQGQTQDGEKSACLRRYDNAWMSFRDHSLYYTTGQHANLRQLKGKSYQAWAKALEESPNNKIKRLAEQLIELIDKFQLEQYDV